MTAARAIAAAVAIGLLLLWATRADGNPLEGCTPVEHKVEYGDTLWGIVARACPNRDPRPILHHLDLDPALEPGQTITITIP